MARRRQCLGFGFVPEESPHHFVVVIDAHPDGPVAIEERFAWDGGGDADAPTDASVSPSEDHSVPDAAEVPPPNGGAPAPRLKVVLDRYRWGRVAEDARAEFNRRLRAEGRRGVTWAGGEIPLAPYLGKELTLLAWAVEDADPTLIPRMLANWRGLAPEERWWLYTTVDATSGHPEHGRDRGWRKAIKIAFSENPADAPSFFGSEHALPTERPLLPLPRPARTRRRASALRPDGYDEPLPLFEDSEP